MRRWRPFSRKGKKVRMAPEHGKANAETLRQFAGRWVAIRDGDVIAAFETFDRLYEDLHSRKESGATILRVPAENEPELVGFG